MMVTMTAMAAMVATEHLQTLLSSQTMFRENISGHGEKVEVLKGDVPTPTLCHILCLSVALSPRVM